MANAILKDDRPSAYSDVQQAAEYLSQLDIFSALHHGDPIPSNAWIDNTGGLYLFDFESAHFDHALLEGMHARMSFPTSGMAFVQTTREFNSLSALGETFTALLVDLRSRWPPEAQNLPFYPVFKQAIQDRG